MKLKMYRIILPVIALIVVGAGFFNYTVVYKTIVKASVFNLSPQLSDINQWHKWNKTFFGSENRQITIKVNNPASFTILQKDNRDAAAEHIAIMPLVDTASQVQWIVQQSGFRWLITKISDDDMIERQLADLKNFVESPNAIYGFPIQIVKVTDRVLCTTQKLVTKDSMLAQVPGMLKDIKAFLSRNSISVDKDYYYLSFFPVGNKIELTVALPVTQEVQNGHGFKFLKFPADGRLLVGAYKGNYADLHQLYSAMDRYMADYHLTKVAQVLEAYSLAWDLKKDQNIRVIYPIY
ncbi:hypothetical protein [Mucilaginibacter agri]|uniref:GyrI-like small molecule binding domain-containing protein n=1 Tax=Mucilaginibacter agri TaxID=2695265 RepID=A0A965ZMX1_9SPHI|nr:hypothetical protein [Mucilaginibacter agri]NCD72516.1 hypothetical protein [Mucilaginibacter agri]